MISTRPTVLSGASCKNVLVKLHEKVINHSNTAYRIFGASAVGIDTHSSSTFIPNKSRNPLGARFIFDWILLRSSSVVDKGTFQFMRISRCEYLVFVYFQSIVVAGGGRMTECLLHCVSINNNNHICVLLLIIYCY